MIYILKLCYLLYFERYNYDEIALTIYDISINDPSNKIIAIILYTYYLSNEETDEKVTTITINYGNGIYTYPIIPLINAFAKLNVIDHISICCNRLDVIYNDQYTWNILIHQLLHDDNVWKYMDNEVEKVLNQHKWWLKHRNYDQSILQNIYR